ncbi:MAG: Hsp33 family molecular chaperone HslO, partial [Pseudomonadales bacterium]|nr:Hsp33 family molecular chaperone HslO [Pseudomonadales bacterium]
YFDQSEQIKTKIWLSAEPGQTAAGLLLQAMPSSSKIFDEDAWPRICTLTETLTDNELRELQNVGLIYRLYHEEAVNLYPPSPVSFRCSCNRERTINALIALGQDELEDIFLEQQKLEVKCEFCNETYYFDYEDLEPYMLELDITEITSDLSPSRTLH